jgi:hypothetical protein
MPFLHFETHSAYEEMFSIVSEVTWLTKNGKKHSPISAEKTESARQSRLSQGNGKRARFTGFEAAYMAADQSLEPKKPIRFKDAVGRKFTFPFELVATWAVRNTYFAVSSNFQIGLTIYSKWKTS